MLTSPQFGCWFVHADIPQTFLEQSLMWVDLTGRFHMSPSCHRSNPLNLCASVSSSANQEYMLTVRFSNRKTDICCEHCIWGFFFEKLWILTQSQNTMMSILSLIPCFTDAISHLFWGLNELVHTMAFPKCLVQSKCLSAPNSYNCHNCKPYHFTTQ